VKEKSLSTEFQNHFWTVISEGIAAAFLPVLILVTTRFVGLEPAGMISYAAAVTIIFHVFITFSAHNIQRVDVREEFCFREYLGFRTATAAAATAAVILFLVIAGFDRLQTLIILFYYFIFLTDAFADVFMGDFHQKGMIRIMGRIRASGFFIALTAFCVMAYTTHDVMTSLLTAGMLMFIVYFMWIRFYRSHFSPIRAILDFSTIKRFIVIMLPVLVLTFIQTYLISAPRIFLGTFDVYEMVAIYSILFTPAAMYNLLLYTPLFGSPMPRTSEAYASGQLKRFYRRIHVMLLIMAAAFIPYIAITWFFGVPLLSWLYNVDLAPFKNQLLWVSIGGIFIPATTFIGTILIIMRKQKAYMYSHIIVGAIVGPLAGVLVWLGGINGAAYSNLVIFLPLSIVVYVIFQYIIRRKLKKET